MHPASSPSIPPPFPAAATQEAFDAAIDGLLARGIGDHLGLLIELGARFRALTFQQFNTFVPAAIARIQSRVEARAEETRQMRVALECVQPAPPTISMRDAAGLAAGRGNETAAALVRHFDGFSPG